MHSSDVEHDREVCSGGRRATRDPRKDAEVVVTVQPRTQDRMSALGRDLSADSIAQYRSLRWSTLIRIKVCAGAERIVKSFNREEITMESTQIRHHDAWNKGKLVGQKAPFKLKEIWSIRVRLEMQGRLRELALFDLGIDSKLRACDLLSLRVRDVCHGDRVAARAIVL